MFLLFELYHFDKPHNRNENNYKTLSNLLCWMFENFSQKCILSTTWSVRRHFFCFYAVNQKLLIQKKCSFVFRLLCSMSYCFLSKFLFYLHSTFFSSILHAKLNMFINDSINLNLKKKNVSPKEGCWVFIYNMRVMLFIPFDCEVYKIVYEPKP
jgi:hypothetical protein